MSLPKSLLRQNWSAVKNLYPNVARRTLHTLTDLTKRLHLSVVRGELILLGGTWYVSHAGLLQIAARRRCSSIEVRLERDLSDSAAGRWVFKAIVYPANSSRGFVGYGDADPSNVSSLVRGAEMRVAETRAVNRALRKAYGIGLCSVEELGATSPPPKPPARVTKTVPAQQPASGNGRPLLRDRLCQLIRQHRLDPEQVKRYAADFCGTQILREASRQLVEDFVNQLAVWVARDREGLLCHLNRYAKTPEPAEVKEAVS